MLEPRIIEHYEREIAERDRLTAEPIGRLEWLRTWVVLGRVLPPPPSSPTTRWRRRCWPRREPCRTRTGSPTPCCWPGPCTT